MSATTTAARPSPRDDIEMQSARPMPKEINIGELVVVAVVVAIVAVLVLFII
jgi:hypothetical protein